MGKSLLSCFSTHSVLYIKDTPKCDVSRACLSSDSVLCCEVSSCCRNDDSWSLSPASSRLFLLSTSRSSFLIT